MAKVFKTFIMFLILYFIIYRVHSNGEEGITPKGEINDKSRNSIKREKKNDVNYSVLTPAMNDSVVEPAGQDSRTDENKNESEYKRKSENKADSKSASVRESTIEGQYESETESDDKEAVGKCLDNVDIKQKEDSGRYISSKGDRCVQVTGEGKESNVYETVLGGRNYFVWCDTITQGGDWTIIQHRFDGFLNFNRNWTDYKFGFGLPMTDFWYGLQEIHSLTLLQPLELLIVLKDFDNKEEYAKYDEFAIGVEDEGYPLTRLGAYSGTAGDSLSDHVGAAFSTIDKDGDGEPSINCAQSSGGGWWYQNISCYKSNLNGVYNEKNSTKSMTWNTFRAYLKEVKIMLRPRAPIKDLPISSDESVGYQNISNSQKKSESKVQSKGETDNISEIKTGTEMVNKDQNQIVSQRETTTDSESFSKNGIKNKSEGKNKIETKSDSDIVSTDESNQESDSDEVIGKCLDKVGIKQKDDSGRNISTRGDRCVQVTAEGKESNVYETVLGGRNYFVWCDTRTQGGGWTIIQHRFDGFLNFNRNWTDYKFGFGLPMTDFWYGLQEVHSLTLLQPLELLIVLKDFDNNEEYAKYDDFSIGPEEEGYPLTRLGAYSGTAGDSLSDHVGAAFSTKDRDSDGESRINCAELSGGGWWYKNISCFKSNLNGMYNEKNSTKSMTWDSFTAFLKEVQIMVRPRAPVTDPPIFSGESISASVHKNVNTSQDKIESKVESDGETEHIRGIKARTEMVNKDESQIVSKDENTTNSKRLSKHGSKNKSKNQIDTKPDSSPVSKDKSKQKSADDGLIVKCLDKVGIKQKEDGGRNISSRGDRCVQVTDEGKESNVYETVLGGRNYFVWCDTTTQGGGWTIIQHRFDGFLNFNRNWTDYKFGFGLPMTDFWYGLQEVHSLTLLQPLELLIVLKDFDNNEEYAKYDDFAIGPEEEGYHLTILGAYSGTAGDSLSDHFGAAFSTKDRDSDGESSINCAELSGGGWWYKNISCFKSNLNGMYNEKNSTKSMTWDSFPAFLKEVQIMVRPRAPVTDPPISSGESISASVHKNVNTSQDKIESKVESDGATEHIRGITARTEMVNKDESQIVSKDENTTNSKRLSKHGSKNKSENQIDTKPDSSPVSKDKSKQKSADDGLIVKCLDKVGIKQKEDSGRNISSRGDRCVQVTDEGKESNVYETVLGDRNYFVWCDTTTQGGGWTIIQHRFDGILNFNRNWTDYKFGFGLPMTDFWYGLQEVHSLTLLQPLELLIVLKDFDNNEEYAKYDDFAIGPEEEGYPLTRLGAYSGTAGDSLSDHVGAAFSTKDRDSDGETRINCAELSGGGWWYKNISCYKSNLNGVYNEIHSKNRIYKSNTNPMAWDTFPAFLKEVSIMVRPALPMKDLPVSSGESRTGSVHKSTSGSEDKNGDGHNKNHKEGVAGINDGVIGVCIDKVGIKQKDDGGRNVSSRGDRCVQVTDEGKESNVYETFLGGRNYFVWCDTTTQGGGWTIIQHRFDGFLNFNRNWTDYKFGFGLPMTDFWYGLQEVHSLTLLQPLELLIVFKDFDNNEEYAKYDDFAIEPEEEGYPLTRLGAYSGTAGDSLSDHVGAAFSTKDRDSDGETRINCAELSGGGWWYKNISCYKSNLNGVYNDIHSKNRIYKSNTNPMAWDTFPAFLKEVSIMVRPALPMKDVPVSSGESRTGSVHKSTSGSEDKNGDGHNKNHKEGVAGINDGVIGVCIDKVGIKQKDDGGRNISSRGDRCVQVTDEGKESNVYETVLGGRNYFVWCDTTTQGGGWTIIQHRFDGFLNFNRNWTDYKFGFGLPMTDFWYGLQEVHSLTLLQPLELLIVLKDFDNNEEYAKYDDFAIGPEEEGYHLTILGAYSGTAGDSLSDHVGAAFSTKDRDSDGESSINCAELSGGGWWYKNISCFKSNLNGMYNEKNSTKSMTWDSFPAFLKEVQIMVRPRAPVTDPPISSGESISASVHKNVNTSQDKIESKVESDGATEHIRGITARTEMVNKDESQIVSKDENTTNSKRLSKHGSKNKSENQIDTKPDSSTVSKDKSKQKSADDGLIVKCLDKVGIKQKDDGGRNISSRGDRCVQVTDEGTESNVYETVLGGRNYFVWCDTTTQGGGWTIIQHRFDGFLNFNRNWTDYKFGFGLPMTDFWHGLQEVHSLTLLQPLELLIVLKDFDNNEEYAKYDDFAIGPEEEGYPLTRLGAYSGTAGDSLSDHVGAAFSTKDRDSDGESRINCAELSGGGWWYKNISCYKSNLNGVYNEIHSKNRIYKSNTNPMAWDTFPAFLKEVSIMVRPALPMKDLPVSSGESRTGSVHKSTSGSEDKNGDGHNKNHKEGVAGINDGVIGVCIDKVGIKQKDDGGRNISSRGDRCVQVTDEGKESNVYETVLGGRNYFVWCDTTTQGGGWTIIQHRFDGFLNFNRNWTDYKFGFGLPMTDFWYGLQEVHSLTLLQPLELLIVLKDFDNNEEYAKYDDFAIEPEEEGYPLTRLGAYSGTAGDSLSDHVGAAFSTKDRDSDGETRINCAELSGGGWWYKNISCYKSNLNGVYNDIHSKNRIYKSNTNPMAWDTFPAFLKEVSIMVRPALPMKDVPVSSGESRTGSVHKSTSGSEDKNGDGHNKNHKEGVAGINDGVIGVCIDKVGIKQKDDGGRNISSRGDRCVQVTDEGKESNVYETVLGGRNYFVWCDTTTQGGGWTIIQHRFDGFLNFNRNWTDYKFGFGLPMTDFWYGLQEVHSLTLLQPLELLIVLKDFDNNEEYAKYDDFAIGPEEEGYHLTILGAYSGTAGDSLSDHVGAAFSTKDRDSDGESSINCAELSGGGWWYKNISCFKSNLNGMYNEKNSTKSMTWDSFPAFLKEVQIMVRPRAPVTDPPISSGESISASVHKNVNTSQDKIESKVESDGATEHIRGITARTEMVNKDESQIVSKDENTTNSKRLSKHGSKNKSENQIDTKPDSSTVSKDKSKQKSADDGLIVKCLDKVGIKQKDDGGRNISSRGDRCVQVTDEGTESNVYETVLGGRNYFVWCDTTTQGGGWTIIQHRFDGFLNFNRNWTDYKFGFGLPMTDFWHGLQEVHSLTLLQPLELLIVLKDFDNNEEYAKYDDFAIGPEEEGYPLTRLGAYSGTAGDSLSDHVGAAFSTKDRDSDGESRINCAELSGGGWWYKNISCYKSNLNGVYNEIHSKNRIYKSNTNPMAWDTFPAFLKEVSIMVRPALPMKDLPVSSGESRTGSVHKSTSGSEDKNGDGHNKNHKEGVAGINDGVIGVCIDKVGIKQKDDGGRNISSRGDRCVQVTDEGKESNVYETVLGGRNYFVWCDTTTQGGGWTIIQHRFDGFLNFNRNWTDYKFGFGLPMTDFWYGLQEVHSLTLLQPLELLIVLKDFDNNEEYAKYDDFAIEPEEEGYPLTRLGAYSGTAGDSLSDHVGAAFSTKDRDSDGETRINCAELSGGGWWYKNISCYKSNLNGVYNDIHSKNRIYKSNTNPMAWDTFPAFLKEVSIMVRPALPMKDVPVSSGESRTGSVHKSTSGSEDKNGDGHNKNHKEGVAGINDGVIGVCIDKVGIKQKDDGGRNISSRDDRCVQVTDEGKESNVYETVLGGRNYFVWCDTTTQGGDWTIIQHRFDGFLNFNRNWTDYKFGFGLPMTDFWYGLQEIHSLTLLQPLELLIVLKDFDNNEEYAKYDDFAIGPEEEGYPLTRLGAYSGTAGDSLSDHVGAAFSTKDRDSDGESSINCAELSGGGWWYKNISCYKSNLNGVYNGIHSKNRIYKSNTNPMAWDTFPAILKEVSIMVRPALPMKDLPVSSGESRTGSVHKSTSGSEDKNGDGHNKNDNEGVAGINDGVIGVCIDKGGIKQKDDGGRNISSRGDRCVQVSDEGKESNVYETVLGGRNYFVWCETTTQGGGWTIIQHRFDGFLNFNQNWTDYKFGFGLPMTDFWYGLQEVHSLTLLQPLELLIVLKDFDNNEEYAKYDDFTIGPEEEGYPLTRLGAYSGTAGDSLSDHVGAAFSTKDRDSDGESSINCAELSGGGWWYKNISCYKSNLNGVYNEIHSKNRIYKSNTNPMAWDTFPAFLKEVSIMVRPALPMKDVPVSSGESRTGSVHKSTSGSEDKNGDGHNKNHKEGVAGINDGVIGVCIDKVGIKQKDDVGRNISSRDDRCVQVTDEGKESNVYETVLGGRNYFVWCDTTTQGGDWTIIQHRFDGFLNFNRNWTDYKFGFGLPMTDFWYGLQEVHSLTLLQPLELLIVLKDFDNNEEYAKYDDFTIGPEEEGYPLTRLGAYSGTAGDSLSDHVGAAFSTKDRDSDGESSINCAELSGGGWWYKNISCYKSNLNGVYNGIHSKNRIYKSNTNPMAWDTFPAILKEVSIMVRPALPMKDLPVSSGESRTGSVHKSTSGSEDKNGDGHNKNDNEGVAGINDGVIGVCIDKVGIKQKDDGGRNISSRGDRCVQVSDEGKESNVYETVLGGRNYFVWCDTTTQGGGWTIIQHRFDGFLNFNRNWTDYKFGFGLPMTDFWYGLQEVHSLTLLQPLELLIVLKDFDNNEEYAKYDDFAIGPEEEGYPLTRLGAYSGTAGDSLSDHVGAAFSTKDRDSDGESSINCAELSGGGWWYKNISCYKSNLNGVHNEKNNTKSMTWDTFPAFLKEVSIMVRPALPIKDVPISLGESRTGNVHKSTSGSEDKSGDGHNKNHKEGVSGINDGVIGVCIDKVGIKQKHDGGRNISSRGDRCVQVTDEGKESNVYETVLGGRNYFVWCDTTTQGGGWTIIQHRFDGFLNFNRNWTDYKFGFGLPMTDFWYGLQEVQSLTLLQPLELLIVLKDFDNNEEYAKYDDFAIGPEDEGYPLTRLGTYNGTAGDSLSDHVGAVFSTKDRDSDGESSINCAELSGGGWWYKNISCYENNLNGVYNETNNFKTMTWDTFRTSLKEVKIMIRPQTPINSVSSSVNMDCNLVAKDGKTSDIYQIGVLGSPKDQMIVFCDATSNGGGWIVIQRRLNGKLSFDENWNNYNLGFGNLYKEFWFGMKKIQYLLSKHRYELLITLQDFDNNEVFAVYDDFVIGTEEEGYFLMRLGAYNGTAGNSLSDHVGAAFSTKDRNSTDDSSISCAESSGGGWWYKNNTCYKSNLNGIYNETNNKKSVIWNTFHHETSLKEVHMMIRPVFNVVDTTLVGTSSKGIPESMHRDALYMKPNISNEYGVGRHGVGEIVNEGLVRNCFIVTRNRNEGDIYDIDILGAPGYRIVVWCDTKIHGGSWIVIQRRIDGTISFNGDWDSYRVGIGNIYEEFWYGLENIYFLTSKHRYELLITLKDFDNNEVFATYDDFAVGSEKEGYPLKRLGAYNGTAGDSLSYHVGAEFSTKDRDNDNEGNINCAKSSGGGWWYSNITCYKSNLNSMYNETNNEKSVIWDTFHHLTSLKEVQMSIRPILNVEDATLVGMPSEDIVASMHRDALSFVPNVTTQNLE